MFKVFTKCAVMHGNRTTCYKENRKERVKTMGLAATQARFLAVTSRKSSCENRSIELAQQKLSLSRELDYASEEYQNALNATRLVWDVDGTGDYRYDLSYDIMMYPSDYNQYLPYFLSRQDGKVAFDDGIMKAVSSVFNVDAETGTCDGGIMYNGNVVYRGDADYEVAQYEAFDKFIEEMKKNKAMSTSVAAKMLNKTTYDPDNATDYDLWLNSFKYQYMPDAGVGGTLLSKECSNMMTANSMISYIDYIVDNAMSGYFPVDSKEWQLAENLIFDFEQKDYVLSAVEHARKQYPVQQAVGDLRYNLQGVLDSTYKTDAGATFLLFNGQYANDANYTAIDENGNIVSTNDEKNNTGNKGVAQYSAKAFTLADLLNEDITLLVNDKQSLNDVLDLITEMITGTSKLNGVNFLKMDVDQWYNACKSQKDEAINGTSRGEDPYNKLIIAARQGGSVPSAEEQNEAKNARLTLAVLNFFDKLAKSMYALLMPKQGDIGSDLYYQVQDTVDSNAFYTALINTVQRLRNANDTTAKNYDSDYVTINEGLGLLSNLRTEAYAQTAVAEANNYNTWVKNYGEWAISLSNLAESFLTDFVNGMDNYQNGCLIGKNAKTSTYITDYADYLYTVDTLDEKETGLWESEFYSIMFNTICNNGCYLNQQVIDKQYLDNALKNGQLFVLSKADNDYFYQSRYTEVSGGHMIVETDTAAIAAAEREYSYKKSQINYKEEKIEIESKQLDAEISELTAELDSVRNLINKNIDKTFKMFQS